MDSVPHMPYMIAQIIVQDREYACPISVSVSADGEAQTAVWIYVQMDVLAMEIAKQINVNVKKGTVLIFNLSKQISSLLNWKF